MNLLPTLREQLKGDVLSNISQQIGANEEQTSTAANGIFAALLGGLANNTSTKTGLSDLTYALDKDHDGSILDDVIGMIGGVAQGQISRSSDGNGILAHVFGNKQNQVAQKISQSSGLTMDKIMKLMPILAPIVMAVIGRMRNSNSNDDQQSSGGGLGDLARILMGSAQSAKNEGFGDLIGTVLGGVLGGQQTQTEQIPQRGGGLLGTIFGKLFKR